MGRQEERKQAAYEIVGANIYDEYFRETFVKGAKWADKTMIDKACEWITQHIEDERYKTPYEESYRHELPHDYFETNMFIDDFRKAMEE